MNYDTTSLYLNLHTSTSGILEISHKDTLELKLHMLKFEFELDGDVLNLLDQSKALNVIKELEHKIEHHKELYPEEYV